MFVGCHHILGVAGMCCLDKVCFKSTYPPVMSLIEPVLQVIAKWPFSTCTCWKSQVRTPVSLCLILVLNTGTNMCIVSGKSVRGL